VGFTRCVGLLKYKKYTPCEPEIISEELGSSGFIVMGTRGLW
jgi:serine/threonine protein phosphatase PrpC